MPLIDCEECFEKMSDKATHCPKCGNPNTLVDQTAHMPGGKSRSIAILLSLLLGCIGAHKFYLNQPGMGLLYLLFSWTLIPLLLSIIEAIGYLFVSDATFRKRYAAN